MSKTTPSDYPIADLISRRWSPRAFSDRTVDAQHIRSLFEAARWAASCNNGQPWAFIVASKENPEAHVKMVECLVEGNQKWARHAPVLAISVAYLNWKRDGKPNRHAQHDVGMASTQLALQAASMGLETHFMAGFVVEKTRETYGIPLDCEPMAAIAIGHPGDPNTLPEDLRARELAPRVRKPQSEFVFADKWENAME